MTHPIDSTDPDTDVLLPHSRRLLTDAIRRNATDRANRWRPSRRIAVLAITGTLITGTAVAATTPWNPDLGGPGDRPTTATSEIPAPQLAALGVLRRDQTDADRSTPVQVALHQMWTLTAGGVHTAGVRLLSETPDSAAVLVPVERSGSVDADPGHPTPELHDALCLKRTHTNGQDPTHAIGGEKCGTLDDLLAGDISFPTYGLVPDGVATVRVTLTTGTVLTAAVANNYYELPIDIEADGRNDPRLAGAMKRAHTLAGQPIEWLDGNGNAVPKRH